MSGWAGEWVMCQKKVDRQLGVHVCIYEGRLIGIWVNVYRSGGGWMGMYACMYVVE